MKPVVVGHAAIDPQRGAGRQLKERLPGIVVQAGPAGTRHGQRCAGFAAALAGAAGLTDRAANSPADPKRKEATDTR